MARTTASAGLRALESMRPSTADDFHKVAVYHAHGCEECGLRYTDSCHEPAVNGRCYGCRTGSERSTWDKDHDPRVCCRTSSKPVESRVELSKYNLGGPGPWFRCTTCSRTHPFNPGTGATP